MLHWIKRWLGYLRSGFGRGGTGAARGRLMGLYLHQANQEKGRRWEGDTAQERRDGKFARKRGRD